VRAAALLLFQNQAKEKPWEKTGTKQKGVERCGMVVGPTEAAFQAGDGQR